jgi:XapX domain-containing protein
MKIYLVALGVGILVGIIYGLLNVRSPAPPVVALVGLLGMLVGEQVVPMAKRLISGEPITAAWIRSDCVPGRTAGWLRRVRHDHDIKSGARDRASAACSFSG